MCNRFVAAFFSSCLFFLSLGKLKHFNFPFLKRAQDDDDDPSTIFNCAIKSTFDIDAELHKERIRKKLTHDYSFDAEARYLARLEQQEHQCRENLLATYNKSAFALYNPYLKGDAYGVAQTQFLRIEKEYRNWKAQHLPDEDESEQISIRIV